jgi:hypothetical protein
MQPIYTVIYASDYLNSSNRVFGSVNSAKTFIQIVLNDLHVPTENSRIKYNSDASASNFIQDLAWLSNKLKDEEGALGIILYAGHGNTTGKLDYYCMEGGNVTEDQMAAIFNGIHDKSLLMILSDCCSSSTEFLDLDYPFVGNWVSFGATLQFEDDLQDYEGGALVEAITSLWNNNSFKYKSTKDMFDTLEDFTINSWRGDLQHFSFYCSNNNVMQMCPFSK